MEEEALCTCPNQPQRDLPRLHQQDCPVFRQHMERLGIPPRRVGDPRVTRAPGRPDPRRQHGDRETE